MKGKPKIVLITVSVFIVVIAIALALNPIITIIGSQYYLTSKSRGERSITQPVI